MPKYTFLQASITHASQELTGGVMPPVRMKPYELEIEMIRMTAAKADLLKFCADLVNVPEFTAVDINGVRNELKNQMRTLLTVTGPEEVVLNGGSTPIYRKLPDGSHWTEDWLQLKPPQGTASPWELMYPQVNPKYKLYPCLRVLISPPR